MSFSEIKPKDDAEWLKIRTEVITATDIGVLLGLNKWKSVAELVEGKTNFKPFENSYTWLGQTLEPVVVEATNKTLNTNFKLFENGSRSFFLDRELGLGATPDAGEGNTLLECKSTKPRNYVQWAEWPPAYYISQLYCQLLCTGRDIGYLSIMSTNMTQTDETLRLPLHIFKLCRTVELDAILIETVKKFWEANAAGKIYRVNRKAAPAIEMKLRFQTEKIHGR